MSDERKCSVVLIAGSVGMIITMIFHPHRMSPAQLDRMVPMIVGTHSLALLSIPVIFLGALGIARWAGGRDRLAVAALVLFGFALVAVMNAAVMNGLVFPQAARQFVAGAEADRSFWKVILRNNFEINQAFARVYAVGAGLAILLWSASILKNRNAAKGIVSYGCVLGVVTAAGIFSGRLRPDVHGFAILVFGQAIWFLLVAQKIWTESGAETASRTT
jgi:hypothetical protein